MPDEDKEILKYNPGEELLKASHIICADLECLLEKIDNCQNNQEKIDTCQSNQERFYTEKKAKHVPSGYSLVTCCSYDNGEMKEKILEEKTVWK